MVKKSLNLRQILPFMLILVAVFAVYFNSIHNPFIWDDSHLVVYNPFIKNFHNFPYWFTNDLLRGGSSNFYRPMQTALYALIYHTSGLRQEAYHLANIILHAIVAVLFFLILRRLYYERVALVASLIFAVHPINTEAVTYISGTADPLCAVFGLGMIVAFLNRKRIAGILLFILALGSKESALMFPFFYLLISWAYEKRVTRQTITWFIWLAGISIIYIILRITVLSFPAHIIPIQFSERFFSAFKSFLIYIQLLVFPKTLSMDRSFTYLKSPLNLPFIAGFTVFCTGLFLLFRFRNHRRQVLPGYWFMLSFLPISGIFTTLNANVSEHWMYTGCIGIFIYLALLLNKAPRKAFVATVSIVILSYGIRSMVRNFDWADEERFFKKSIEAFPDSPRLHHNLGVVYQHRGEYEKALSELKQAAFLRNKIMPGKDTLTSLMIAETLVKLGRVVEAGPYYNEVLATNPVHPIALADLADIAYADGDVQSAVKLLQICIENNQSYQPAYYKLGRVYLDQKNYQQAKKYLSIAVQMHPEDSLAHNLLGVTLKNTGNTAEAIREFELAVKYNPGETSFMLNLAFLLRENNQLQPAIYWYERAASIQPENPAILNELAVTYAISHNIAHAVTIWERILARYPDFAPAKENLAKALKTQKQL